MRSNGATGDEVITSGAGVLLCSVPSVAPQPLQNRDPDGGIAPPFMHAIWSLAPHSLQKRDPSVGSDPHCVQIIQAAGLASSR